MAPGPKVTSIKHSKVIAKNIVDTRDQALAKLT